MKVDFDFAPGRAYLEYLSARDESLRRWESRSHPAGNFFQPEWEKKLCSFWTQDELCGSTRVTLMRVRAFKKHLFPKKATRSGKPRGTYACLSSRCSCLISLASIGRKFGRLRGRALWEKVSKVYAEESGEWLSPDTCERKYRRAKARERRIKAKYGRLLFIKSPMASLLRRKQYGKASWLCRYTELLVASFRVASIIRKLEKRLAVSSELQGEYSEAVSLREAIGRDIEHAQREYRKYQRG